MDRSHQAEESHYNMNDIRSIVSIFLTQIMREQDLSHLKKAFPSTTPSLEGHVAITFKSTLKCRDLYLLLCYIVVRSQGKRVLIVDKKSKGEDNTYVVFTSVCRLFLTSENGLTFN